jgi:chorismate mutase
MIDDEELVRLRAAMNVCNHRLAAVLHERARLVRSIGELKRARGAPAVDEERERQMLAAVQRSAPAGGYSQAALGSIFAAVFAASREIAARGT